MPTADRSCVRVLTDMSHGPRRDMARAIVEAATAANCQIRVCLGDQTPDEIQSWKREADAIIFARSASDRRLAAALDTDLPLVLLSSERLDHGLPSVLADERRIGWLAGKHLIDRNCRHFGYVGVAPHEGAALRLEGLAAALTDHGVTSDIQTLHISSVTDRASDPLIRQWIADLGNATGVLSFSDLLAIRVLDAAELTGRVVPRDIALVGIGNDDLLCSISNPTLSSVDANSSQIGREALAMALQLVRGETVSPLVRRIEPLGVVRRGSTKLAAMIEHPLVRAALNCLDNEPIDTMSVDRLLNILFISRSTLDRAFRETLGYTAHHEIRQRRLRMVRNLLTETQLSGVEIATRTGYRHLSNLSTAFKSEYGMSLTAFRKRYAR